MAYGSSKNYFGGEKKKRKEILETSTDQLLIL